MKLSLDIAFFGSSIVSAFRNGSATYFRGIVRALAARGHNVTFFEPRVEGRQRHRDVPNPPWVDVVVHSGTDATEIERALERARRADVVVKATSIGVFDDLLEREIPRALKPGATSIFWDVDAARTIARLDAKSDAAALGAFDLVFTSAGGPSVVRSYVRHGARTCVSIAPALDPTTHYPVPPSPTWFADASMLVNYRTDRERRVRELFFDAAALLPDRTFLLGGSDWDEVDVPANVRAIGHVYTAEHNGFHAGARAVLAFACDDVADHGWSPPARLFEAAGAGACLFSNGWEGLDSFLEPAHEVLVVRDADELAARIRDLDPIRGRAIGAAARARVLAQHSYGHRAQLVESVLLKGAPSMEAAS